MRTIFFKNKPCIISTASVGGPKESSGGIKDYLKIKLSDDMYGESTFEKAESRILYASINQTIIDSKIDENKIGAIISGDLLNQIIASTFSARNFKAAYLGVYNACSTFTEALTIGATFVNANHLNNVICATSSHFSSAERQYRYPLELGSTRPPLSQWTVTGSGACMLAKSGSNVKITAATLGRIIDYGVVDVNNMGAAMAPAAADTIITHFQETGLSPSDYDLI
ncbi:MAG: stage V sporulation protein AD, partial [Clostridia bacterium]|nr:stage V sporulation protein AD [Clostridia bacterium]